MTCEECRELGTHEFRSQEDLVHAVQVAALEVDRGVLRRIDATSRSASEDEAVASALASEALPTRIAYRFQCTQCGDRFALEGDVYAGAGSWTREESMR